MALVATAQSLQVRSALAVLQQAGTVGARATNLGRRWMVRWKGRGRQMGSMRQARRGTRGLAAAAAVHGVHAGGAVGAVARPGPLVAEDQGGVGAGVQRVRARARHVRMMVHRAAVMVIQQMAGRVQVRRVTAQSQEMTV